MKILVTGGAGFIGSHVADAYLESGHKVVILDNLSSGYRKNLPIQAKFVKMDLRNRSGILKLFKKERFQLVSNHAAQASVQFSVKNPIFDAEVNVLGLLNLLEAGRATGLRKFIHISSGGTVYGESRKPPLSEEAPREPFSPYGIAKSVGEDYLRYYKKVYGIDYSSMRYSNVYGPRQLPNGEASVVPTFMLLMLRGKRPFIFGDGGMLRDYTYVGDIVRANLLILRKGSGRCYNIGTGRPTSVNQLFKVVAAELGFSGKARRAPMRPGDVQANWLSASKARRELGWSASTSLEEGIRLTAAFLRSGLPR